MLSKHTLSALTLKFFFILEISLNPPPFYVVSDITASRLFRSYKKTITSININSSPLSIPKF